MLTIIGAAHYIFGPTKKRPQHGRSSVTSMDLCIIFVGTCQDRSQERSKNDLSWQIDRHVSSYLERIQPSPVWTNYVIFQKPWNFLYEHFGRMGSTMYKSHGSLVKPGFSVDLSLAKGLLLFGFPWNPSIRRATKGEHQKPPASEDRVARPIGIAVPKHLQRRWPSFKRRGRDKALYWRVWM